MQGIVQKTQSGKYFPAEQHYNYEAGVDLMLLEAVDGPAYRPQMTLIADFLVNSQLSNGSWYYPAAPDPDSGDTSITQYAILGLWAATRVGIEVPLETLERCLKWHFATQRTDGGFAYHAFERRVATSTGTMTAAGASNLLIIRRILFGEAEIGAEIRPADVKRRFGVLEKFTDDRRTSSFVTPTIRLAVIDKAVKDSVNWSIAHFTDRNKNREMWMTYHMYCIERLAALLDVTQLGSHEWYDEGADELLLKQLSDGSWSDDCKSVAATALSLMFLSKATATLVPPKIRVNLLGGGLQAGGRGLPDNLDAVQVKDGMVSARKIVGPVDSLLSELERASDAKVEDVQAAIVEAVQLDRPEELIGQMARLRRLATDARSEVRRTALWALGRSGDLSATPLLIQGLSDPDIEIAREASLGLCILSRRPEGCGRAIDPTDDIQLGLKPTANDNERNQAVDQWRTESRKRWTEWYQKNRKYDDRDDRTTLKRTNK